MNRRMPAVAGSFYPADPAQLKEQVQSFLAQADKKGPCPKALIGPHAGTIYSGPIAASAYVHLIPTRDQIKRVILLGPAHHVPVRGLAASRADSFVTPLGDVPLDKDATQELTQLTAVSYNDEAHAPEHSLELHLPFLQEVLGDFSLVPLVVGMTEMVSASNAALLALASLGGHREIGDPGGCRCSCQRLVNTSITYSAGTAPPPHRAHA